MRSRNTNGASVKRHAAKSDDLVATEVGKWLADMVAVMPKFVVADVHEALKAAISRSASISMADDQDARLARLASAVLAAVAGAASGPAERAHTQA